MAKPSKNNRHAPRAAAVHQIAVIGMMTGTSCDGLDASAIAYQSGGNWTSLMATARPYPSALRKRVLHVQNPGTRLTLRELLTLDRDLSIFYAKTADSIAKKIRAQRLIQPQTPLVVANHGQTIAHHPDLGVTLQLGNPARIAAITGLTAIGQFRDGDMAVSGQGAPLAPRYHLALAKRWFHARDLASGVAIHNLGGISNLSYLRIQGAKEEILAFDTGPANAWIDYAIEKTTRGKLTFDRDGKIARQQVALALEDARAIDRFLRLPYLRLAPPKSTGRDDFTLALFDRLLGSRGARSSGSVATATLMTATSILDSYERWIIAKRKPLKKILFCGGGAKNGFLMQILEREFRVRLGIQCGVVPYNPQAIESEAFAYFGIRALLALPLGGGFTGAREFGPPAHIVPGKNWNQVLATLTQWSA